MIKDKTLKTLYAFRIAFFSSLTLAICCSQYFFPVKGIENSNYPRTGLPEYGSKISYVEITEKPFYTESSRELRNPNREFYYIYGFSITDEETDYVSIIQDRYQADKDTCLTMVQINLQAYRDREITPEGLANIEALFAALEGIDKELIVRFLYDWSGESEKYEPDSLDIVLRHMQQLETTLRGYSRKIFTLQGLFIGNWGEMNNTKLFSSENIQRLSSQLAAVTEESTYLSVRTPAQWRIITGQPAPFAGKYAKNSLAGRLGLFNDGMLGNAGDCGTYGSRSAVEVGNFEHWNREEELAFQDQLCRQAPNGGEVISENPYNDFDNALKDLATMHVTYLNRDYDRNVFEKWKKTIVQEDSCFDGMDGLTYIKRHLGYRLLITDTALGYEFPDPYFSVDILLRNVGFAPIYKKHEIKLYLYSQEKEHLLSYDPKRDLSGLAGGNEAEKTEILHMEIPIKDLQQTEYELFFSITDIDSGKRIFLANEQDAGAYGYPAGKIKLHEVRIEDLF